MNGVCDAMCDNDACLMDGFDCQHIHTDTLQYRQLLGGVGLRLVAPNDTQDTQLREQDIKKVGAKLSMLTRSNITVDWHKDYEEYDSM